MFISILLFYTPHVVAGFHVAAHHINVIARFLELAVLGILLHLNSLDVLTIFNVYQIYIFLQIAFVSYLFFEVRVKLPIF